MAASGANQSFEPTRVGKPPLAAQLQRQARMTRQKAIEVALLLIALLPLIVLLAMAVRIWSFGAPIELWRAPAWDLYLLQVLALFGFAFHVLANCKLEGQRGHWLWQIFLYQQVAMFGYWLKHVRGKPCKLRP